MGILDKLKNKILGPKNEEAVINESDALLDSTNKSQNKVEKEANNLELLKAFLGEVSKQINNTYVENIKQSIADTKIGAIAKSDLIKNIGQRLSKDKIVSVLKDKFTKDNLAMLTSSFAMGAVVKGAVNAAKISLGLGGGLAIGATAGALTGFLKEGIKRKIVFKNESDVRDALTNIAEKIADKSANAEDIDRLVDLIVYAEKLVNRKRILDDKGVAISKDKIAGVLAGARRILLENNQANIDNSADPVEKFKKILVNRSKNQTYFDKIKGFVNKIDPRKEALVKTRDLTPEDTKKILRATLVGVVGGALGATVAHLILGTLIDEVPSEVLSKDIDIDEAKNIVQEINVDDDIRQSIVEPISTTPITEDIVTTPSPSAEMPVGFTPDMVEKGSGLYANLQNLYPQATFEEIKEMAEQGLRSGGVMADDQNIDDFIASGADKKMSAEDIADVINKVKQTEVSATMPTESEIEIPAVSSVDNSIVLPKVETPSISTLDSSVPSMVAPENITPKNDIVVEIPKPPEQSPSSGGYWSYLLGGLGAIGAGAGLGLGIKKIVDSKPNKAVSEEGKPNGKSYEPSEWTGNSEIGMKLKKIDEEKKGKKEPLINRNDNKIIEDIQTTPPYKIIEKEKSEEILSKFEIKSGRSNIDEVKTFINEHEILHPKYEVNVGKYKYMLSGIYKNKDGYNCVVAYIEAPNEDTGEVEIVARTFYQSGSNSFLRNLPELLRSGAKELYFKGRDEDSLMAPLEVQEAYAKILDEQNNRALDITTDPEDSEIVFAGLAKNFIETRVLETATPGTASLSPLEATATEDIFKSITTNPRDLKIDEDKKPDFKKPVRSFEIYNKVYDYFDEDNREGVGLKVTFDSFISRDNKKTYVFGYVPAYKDRPALYLPPNVYINNQEINSAGVYKEWIKSLPPRYEYPDNIKKQFSADLSSLYFVDQGDRVGEGGKYIGNRYFEETQLGKDYKKYKESKI